MAGGSIKSFVRGLLAATLLVAWMPAGRAEETTLRRGISLGSITSFQQRKRLINELPLSRLTPQARQQILSVAQSPTLYRRLPTQAIDCDKDMFLFITRHPEVLVGMWDLMGITNVKVSRTGPYQLETADGSGTKCTVDLIYGDQNVHIYYANGSYDGRLVAKPILGRGIFVLRSSYARNASGGITVTGTLDCFVQFDSFGADLVARTLSGIIGRSADHNFVETAAFIGQVATAARRNPPALVDVANRLPQVSNPIKQQFTDVITTVARRAGAQVTAPATTLRTINPVSTRQR